MLGRLQNSTKVWLVGLVLRVSLSTADNSSSVACGEPGAAYFVTNSSEDALYDQYMIQELYAATRCYVAEEGCHNPVLPEAARRQTGSDSSAVKAYYGTNISHWCTGKVTLFDMVINGLYVSHIVDGFV